MYSEHRYDDVPGKGGTNLVQAARVAVEEDTHAFMQELTGGLLREVVLPAVDGGAEKGNGDVGTVPSRDGWRRVSGTQKIDITQEAVARVVSATVSTPAQRIRRHGVIEVAKAKVTCSLTYRFPSR